MSQKFFTSTLACKYIKYLLSYTPLPLYPTIEHNQYMIEGCLYVYKDKVLKCTSSGIFSATQVYYQDFIELTCRDDLMVQDVEESEYLILNTSKKYEETKQRAPYDQSPSDSSKPNTVDSNFPPFEPFKYESETDMLYKTVKDIWGNVIFNHADNGGIIHSHRTSYLCVSDDYCQINNFDLADYEIVNTFKMNQFIPGVTQQIISTSNSYDSTVHKYLGDYLRLLKNQYNLDLMPLYNCYGQEVSRNIKLIKSNDKLKVTGEGASNRKVLLVPIKFNTTYTIAMDCNSPFLLKGVFYNNGLITTRSGTEFLSNYLQDSTIQLNNSSFNKPFTFKVSNIDEEDLDPTTGYTAKYLQQFEKHLHLAIEVPVNFNSSLAVLEGDYSLASGRLVSDIAVLNTSDPSKIYPALVSNPSLFQLNDGVYHAFSDKLIAYLLRNTIDTREYIDDNVANVQKKINYTPTYLGQWDDKLRYILYQNYLVAAEDKDLLSNDILGYVDRDMEEAIRKGYMTIGI